MPLYGLISYDVWVAGGYAYVATTDVSSPTNNLLRVIDVSNPHLPSEVGYVSFDGGTVGALQKAGNFIYIAAGAGGIKVVNVTDKAHPALEPGSYSSSSLMNASGITVRGSLLYVANGSAGNLQIFNISNPTSPIFLGKAEVGGNVSEVVLSGAYAYVAAGFAGLKIINISSSTNPVVVGSYGASADFPISGVAVASGYVFLAKGLDGFQIIDASNPTAIVSKGSVSVPITTPENCNNGNYAHMAGEILGIVDISFWFIT